MMTETMRQSIMTQYAFPKKAFVASDHFLHIYQLGSSMLHIFPIDLILPFRSDTCSLENIINEYPVKANGAINPMCVWLYRLLLQTTLMKSSAVSADSNRYCDCTQQT